MTGDVRIELWDIKAADKALRLSCPVMRRLVAKHGPCGLTIEHGHDVFRALSSAILSQQVSGAAAETIKRRVAERGGGDEFPSAKSLLLIPPDDLRACGVSAAKAQALVDLATKVNEGDLPTLLKLSQMTDDQVIDALVDVKGVGRWTAEMFLMFRLGRPDVLSLGDFGLKKGFMRAYGMRTMPSPTTMERKGRLWAPWRSAASWYLWRASEAEA